MRWITLLLGALTLSLAASPAQAGERGAFLFDTPAVGEAELDGVRGTASPGGRLTKGAVTRVADDEARGAFRQTGAVAATQLDWWFSYIGLELIASNARAASA